MLTQFLLSAFCCHCLAAAALSGQAPPPKPGIVIDAKFEDWSSIAPVLIDPADAPEAFIDLGEVRVTSDERFVHVLIDFGRIVNAQGLDGAAMLLFDADGDLSTGKTTHQLPGVDIIIDLTPPNPQAPDKLGMGMALRSTTYTPESDDPTAHRLTPYDIGLMFAPTHAGRRMEFRLQRGVVLPQTPPAFADERFSCKLVAVDVAKKLVDETDIFTKSLPPLNQFAAGSTTDEDRLARPANADVRILSWNAQHGAMFNKPDSFIRVIQAVDPDVILFQEMSDRVSEAQVRDFLNSSTRGDKRWNVMLGRGGGNLRCAIASTQGLERVDALDPLAYRTEPDKHIRANGALAEIAGRRLLAISVHLRCCGRIGGPEDETRKQEAHAIQQATAAHIAALRDSHGVDGLIIAGDFNLVGSRDPLEILQTGIDLDGSALSLVDAYQLDQLSNATWGDVTQPFAPGRLDFVLHSDATISIVNAFVLDSRDLSPALAAKYNLPAETTEAASDHLPIVVDLQWK